MATKKRPLIRPNFEQHDIQNRTFWLDKNPINDGVFKTLLKNIPGRAPDEMRRIFLSDVLVRIRIPLMRKGQARAQVTEAKIENVKTQARALLQSLAALDPVGLRLFRAGAVEVALLGDASQKVDFLEDARPKLTTPGAFWDAVQNLENAASCAAGLLNPQAGKADKHALSRAIILTVFQAYLSHFGKAPPLSESGWFTKWLSDLGEKMGHPFSAKLAATTLKLWQADQGPPS
ncbi:hypothetical protein B9Z51_02590 [Limnohabitans sp. T6-5]|uniref:hypothetical protein n=1 Tax=Limnohabitans sp. T6-5 TaxID=1100724 RepID=UPI000DD1BEA4|nr:hypothetical protein [Limnohabitans sp. T6-5]PUE11216.1 hypothetical protein B9Z51_02590 [Limnohabitans sp. T6-5]